MTNIKWIGMLCMLAGSFLLLLPMAKESYEEHCQQVLLEAWQEKKQTVTAPIQGSSANILSADQALSRTADITEGESVIGILRIPAIDLVQPILAGATSENLKISVSALESSGKPGEAGNFVVAGHNSRTYGRHFNRLGELQTGDEVIVECIDGAYTYQIADAYVVNEDEVWVLEAASQAAEITLLTCYYPKEGKTQRLVVKGTVKSQERG